MINKTSFRFYEMDGLRVLAALSVVFYHYFYYYGSTRIVGMEPTRLTDWILNLSKYGFLGVELFFSISGFVILYSANNKLWYDFLRGRVLRIFPMLWVGASLTFIVVFYLGYTSREPTLIQYLANLTLLHRFVFDQPHLDGVYWTLTVELRFYFIIGLMLAFNALTKRNVMCVMVVWSLAGIIYLCMGRGANFLASGGAFAIGVGFYYLLHDGRKVSNLIFVLFSMVACAVSICLNHNDANLNKIVFFVFVVFVAILFYLIVSGFSSGIPKGVLLSLGGITYPLYLIHQEIGYSILQYSPNGLPYVYNASLLSVVMVFISYILCRYCEPPMKSLFKLVIEREWSRNKVIQGM